MTLEVLICTHGREGLKRVARMSLPQMVGVSYLVSWQRPEGNDETPCALSARDDIKVVVNNCRCLSANRNFAFRHASGDVVLIADNDLRYFPEALRRLSAYFQQHPDVEFVTTRYEGPDNKKYPDKELALKPWPRYFYVTSFEIALRRDKIGDLCFDERFGAGNGMFSVGEEDIFVMQALHRGLKGRFLPLTLCRHDDKSTGFRNMFDPGVLRACGTVIVLRFGYLGSLPRLILKVWRTWRQGGKITDALRYILQGACRTPRDIYKSLHP